MVKTSRVAHIIFHRKISKKKRKITRTLKNYANENYVLWTVLIKSVIKFFFYKNNKLCFQLLRTPVLEKLNYALQL